MAVSGCGRHCTLQRGRGVSSRGPSAQDKGGGHEASLVAPRRVARGCSASEPSRPCRRACWLKAQAAAPYANLTPAEAATLEAIVARLIPADASGPGALEAGAARYIDGALGSALAAQRPAYAARARSLGGLRARHRGRTVRRVAARAPRRRAHGRRAEPRDRLHAVVGRVLRPRAGPHAGGHVRRSAATAATATSSAGSCSATPACGSR